MRTFALAALLLLLPPAAWAFDPASGCVRCHGDRESMRRLGAEEMYMDPARVDREVGMKGVPTCVSCHLGDPAATEKEAAHAAMVRPLLMVNGEKRAGESMIRPGLALQPLVPRRKGPSSMLPDVDPEQAAEAGVEGVRGLFWHDRDPVTFAYSPAVARRTCGACHPSQTEAYNRSGMGLVLYQRANRSFAQPLPGPHNCGAWFGDNHERLAAETSVPFTAAQSAANDRSCNACHAGCNDCHYQPHRGEGRHLFARKPDSLTCYGGGRGVACHAGPMERRRGAGFLRDEFAHPRSLYAGAHREAGLECLDCHSLPDHQSGHMASAEARGSCQRCHGEIAAAVKESYHGRVDCSACHIDEIGGYQFTFWGPGAYAGNETPYAKHSGYYGVRDKPTLIRTPEGRWIPTKPYPMAVLNQKKELPPSGVVFRAVPETTLPGRERIGEPASIPVSRRPEQTNDAFIVAGTREAPGDGKAILWIQMDKVSHSLGGGRPCDDCHASPEQSATSEFTYFDKRNVKAPVVGSYRIVADGKGMRFSNLVHSEIKPQPDRRVEDFAPFVRLPGAWNVEGIDFSIPSDRARVAAAKAEVQSLIDEVDELEKKTEDEERIEQLGRVRALAWHRPESARKLLQELREKK